METIKYLTKLCLASLIIASATCAVSANTISFRGGIAEQSCSLDLNSVNCFNQQTNQLDSQTIPLYLSNKSIQNYPISIETNLNQINTLVLNKVGGNEVIISLNYN